MLARKAEGITDEQARSATCPPSDLALLGLIRHMSDVERLWFRQSLLGEGIPPIYGLGKEDLHPPSDATVGKALATYWEEIRVTNRNLAAASLDDFAQGEPNPGQHKLRRAVVHMIEEYARHCGNADLLRHAIDGTTGD